MVGCGVKWVRMSRAVLSAHTILLTAKPQISTPHSEYARIFKFQNFQASHSRVLAEMEEVERAQNQVRLSLSLVAGWVGGWVGRAGVLCDGLWSAASYLRPHGFHSRKRR